MPPTQQQQRRHWRRNGAFVLILMTVAATLSCAPSTDAPAARGESGSRSATRDAPAQRRPLDLFDGGVWIGNGISYGPFRDGQGPHGAGPSRAQIREDLHLMRKHWRLLRMYAARREAAHVLEIIRTDNLGLKVMLGAWIAPETQASGDGDARVPHAEAIAANRAEVAELIRLANAYPAMVIAVTVGNETQVFWSAHRVQTDALLNYIRQVRRNVTVPVSTADDFRFWITPESIAVARELDFIAMHVYAMWNGQPFENAMLFTRQEYARVQATHPDHPVLITETGWATQKHDQGEQARLIVGAAGEAQQRIFHHEFTVWTTRNRIGNFFFEAFDENWKGGPHPNEVEKHWGLFRADRTPKAALQDVH